MFHSLLHGLRHGRASVAMAIAIMALVVASVTLMASVIVTSLVDRGPYQAPDRVLGLQFSAPSLQYPRIYFPLDEARVLCDAAGGPDGPFAACLPMGVAYVMMSGDGEPAHLNAGVMPAETFRQLGVRPLLGRVLTTADDRPGASAVVVLSEDVWRQSFGSDPGVIGRIVRIDGLPHEVVGVMPRAFTWGVLTAWLPMRMDLYGSVTGRFVQIAGWLRDGATDAQAAARLDSALAGLAVVGARTYPGESRITFSRPAMPLLRADVRQGLLMLAAGVALLALAGGVNVAAILLARLTGRLQDLRIRAWLGASRAMLVTSVVAESAVIATVGAAIGVGLAYAGLPALAAALPPAALPLGATLAIDVRVLAVAVAWTVAISLACGLVPAWFVTAPTARDGMRTAAVGSSDVVSAGSIWRLLVSVEVATAMLLLVMTAVLVRGVLALRAEPLQYSPEGVVAFGVTTSEQRYPTGVEALRFLDRAVGQLRALPGVEVAAVVAPASPRTHGRSPVVVSGASSDRPEQAGVRVASADYFPLFRIPFLRGRAFAREDERPGFPVAVVNEAFVRQFSSDREVLGRSVQLSGLRQPGGGPTAPFQIVGVFRDVPNDGQRPGHTEPEVVVPVGTAVMGRNWFLLTRASGPGAADVVRPVQRAIWAIDPEQAFRSVRSEDEALWAARYGWPTFRARLLGVFGLSALLLAGAGTYGILLYTTLRQRREIAVRLALGLAPDAIARFVLGRGLRPVLAGVLAGAVVAVAAGGLLRGMLDRVSPWDPVAFAVAGLAVLMVAIPACYPAARRAARIAPQSVLRGD